MASIREHVILDAPADSVWNLVGNPGAIAEWAPGIAACTIVGDRRSLTLTQGGIVEEEIVTSDPV